ncbi:MAG: hypothetical protein WBP81_17595 [Solirubrobacteraceae bacterium]
MSIEHVDVLTNRRGAGLSGIGAGYRLGVDCPGNTYAILEARDCIGGTWDLFRYPGVLSDSDMYTLGYAFRLSSEAKAIADGPRSSATFARRQRTIASTVTSASTIGSCVPSGRQRKRGGRWSVLVVVRSRRQDERSDHHERAGAGDSIHGVFTGSSHAHSLWLDPATHTRFGPLAAR